MPLSCTDIPAPAQGLADHAYDQSLSGRQRRRQRLAQRRRIAAYARLVLAVAEGRRLADAELRDLLLATPDVVEAWHLRRDLERAGLVAPTGMDGRPSCNTVGTPVATPVATPGAVTASPRVTYHGSFHLAFQADNDRQLDLPLAETDGRAAP